MAQIQKGDTFADGQQVTAARLNQFLDSATVLPNIITDQTNIATNGVASNDTMLVYDNSATALREATASDLLNSNIPITAPSVTAGTGSDITLTPQDGTIVTSVAYVGTTTSNTVTSNAHGLTAGQVVTVSGATGSQYNGTYRIASVTTNTFTYNLDSTVTAGSGTLSYTKQGSVKNIKHEVINGNLYVDGNAIITGTTVQTGAVTQNGAVTMNSTLSVAGNIVGNLNIPTAPTSGNNATNKTYVDGTVSKTTNGYLILPNGLIMQWGFSSSNPPLTVTFPTAFPTACLNLSLTYKTNVTTFQAGRSQAIYVVSISTSSFTTSSADYNSTSVSGFYWFAIGY